MRVAEHQGNKFLGPNDLTFARNGDLYFTDPGTSDLRHPDGRVFRPRPDGTTNIVLPPDGTGFIVTKSETGSLLCADFPA